jgi:hypothetical protein
MVAVAGSFERGIVTAADVWNFNAQQVRDPGWEERSFAQVQYNARGDLYLAGSYFPERADVWRSEREACCSDWDRRTDLPAPRGAGALLFLSSGAAALADNSRDRLLYLGQRAGLPDVASHRIACCLPPADPLIPVLLSSLLDIRRHHWRQSSERRLPHSRLGRELDHDAAGAVGTALEPERRSRRHHAAPH